MTGLVWTAAQIAGWVLLVPLIVLAFLGLRRSRTAAMRRDIEARARLYEHRSGGPAGGGGTDAP